MRLELWVVAERDRLPEQFDGDSDVADVGSYACQMRDELRVSPMEPNGDLKRTARLEKPPASSQDPGQAVDDVRLEWPQAERAAYRALG
jgi:hypothetical protein